MPGVSYNISTALAHSLKYKACMTYNSCRTGNMHLVPNVFFQIISWWFLLTCQLWSAQIFGGNTLRCQLFMKAGLYLSTMQQISSLIPGTWVSRFFSWLLREARCSVILPSGKTNVSCSPGHLSSSRPLSVTLIYAFTEWRSCPQPVLVLGYLGKGTDPRIERTPLDTLFRATLNVRLTLAVLLCCLLE